MPQLEGRTALVTGSSKGVGRGIAIELARRGADVAINYNSDQAGAEETAATISEQGPKAIIVQGNVASSAEVDRVFATVLDAFGRLDILVNNAGVQTWAPLLDLSEPDWDRVLDTNLKGCFLCTQRAARHMKENGRGRIINIGSGSNKFAFPKLVSYTSSKGGIDMLTKVSAVELGAFGITVNCVAPGAIEIERTKHEAPDFAGTWAAQTPLGRVGTPLDVARVVAFFASDDAEFVSGQTLFVDGGLFSRPVWPY